jgi:RNA polymerase sigma-70 factor (ECF subfamily)
MKATKRPDLTSEFARLRPYLLRLAHSHLGSVGEAEDDPAERFALDEAVSMALLIVLESLSPAEGSAFLLHDVFGYSFEEVARILRRSPDATHQLASRGRRHVQARRPRYPASEEEQRRVAGAFAAAAVEGDVAALIELLQPDATFTSDGGGRVDVARRVFQGAERIARITAAAAGHYRGRVRAAVTAVNGVPGVVAEVDGEISVMSLILDGGRIGEIAVVRNPEKVGLVRRSRTWASEALGQAGQVRRSRDD